MFLHAGGGPISRGPAAQTVNGDIVVRAPGLTSNAVSVIGLRSRGLAKNILSMAVLDLFSVLVAKCTVCNRLCVVNTEDIWFFGYIQ
jgi:hypothetical protein